MFRTSSHQKLQKLFTNFFKSSINKISHHQRITTTNIANNSIKLINNNNTHQKRTFSLSFLLRENDNNQTNPAEVLFNSGMDEYSQRNFPKALEHFVHAEQIEPNNPSIVLQMANTLELMGKFQDGFEEYSRFIEIYETALDDEHRSYYGDAIVKAWLGAGNCVKSIERYEDAIQHYSKVLDFKEHGLHNLGFYNRASCYFHLGKFREAIEDFTEMIKVLNEQDMGNEKLIMTASQISTLDASACYYFKALCHVNLGEFEQAINDLTLIINDFEKKDAAQTLNNAMSTNDVRFNAYYTRAECYLRSGDFEHCIQDTNTVIGIIEMIDSSNKELLSNLYLTKADLLFEMKHFDIALESCVKGVELNPNNSRALFTGAILLKLLKQDEQALTFLKRVIELEPDNSQAKEILIHWESKGK